MKYIASCSFGKDSLAMIHKLVEKGYPLDEIVYFNNGMEFKAVYDIRDYIENTWCQRNGIGFKEIKPKNPFLYDMLERPVKERKGGTHKGYSWCGGRCRWGTAEKTDAIDRYCKDSYGKDNFKIYIGIAHDEDERIKKEREIFISLPLVEWGMPEGEALLYCYKKDFYWEENHKPLYSILDRVSCWCCRNKNLKELKNYYRYLPEYWEKLKALQAKTDRPFREGKESIFDLEKRFAEGRSDG